MKHFILTYNWIIIILFFSNFNSQAQIRSEYQKLFPIQSTKAENSLIKMSSIEMDSQDQYTIQSGKWIATAEVGLNFEFEVNDKSENIIQWKFIYFDWKCGIVTSNGSVTVSSNWVITNHSFSIKITLAGNKVYNINGQFAENGIQANGNWDMKSPNGNCSGTWNASPDGVAKIILVPSDFATIQEGINYAAEGDTVRVAAGEYHENNIQMKPGVAVCGAGIDLSVVDGDSLTVFRGADDALLEGFTITNASKFLEEGVNCWSSTPIIQNNKFMNCDCGISVADNAIIRNNIFSENGFSAIFCGSNVSDKSPQIKGNLIANNKSGDGITSVSSDFLVINNTIHNNNRGIWVQKSSSDLTPVQTNIVNNIISDNRYNGIYLASGDANGVVPSNMIIKYNDVWNNSFDYTSNYIPDPSNISDDPLFVSSEVYSLMYAKSNEKGVNIQDKMEITETRNGLKNIQYQQNSLNVENEKSSLLLIPSSAESNEGIDPEDYHLKSDSPCIDAGDPESPLDPDSTISDIGAFYYEHIPNNPPVVSNIITDMVLYIDSTDFTRDLEKSPKIFSETDTGDVLYYSVTSSNSSVVNAAISGSILTIIPVFEGLVTITVTANDGNGGIVSTDFQVEVKQKNNTSPGKFGGCLVLDGNDDYAEAYDHEELDLGNQTDESLTLEAWVKFEEFGSADIISKSNAYRLYTETSTAMGNKTRVLGFIVKSGTSDFINAVGKTVYGGGFWIDGWHHVAGVYNNTTGELSLYMDGELLSRWEPGKNQINNSSAPLYVGTNLNGCIDEMRISKNARYEDESYEVPVAPFFTDEKTTALWHFDDPLQSMECQDCCKENNCLFLFKGAYLTSTKLFAEKVVDRFELYRNYPNPFSGSTTIEFNVLKASHIQVQVYDILGNEVKTLIDRKYLPGSYQIIWNGKNNEGLALVSGIYMVKMQSGEFISVKKVLLKR